MSIQIESYRHNYRCR